MEVITLVPAQRYPTPIELEHRDWKFEWPHESRRWICKQIESLLAKLFKGNFISLEIPAIAEEFEDKIFEDMAKSEVDYLRKIIFKLFCIIGDSEPICLHKDEQTGSASSTQSETNPDVTTKNLIQGHEMMPQYSNCHAVQMDVHRIPATSLHDGNVSENSISCTGNHNQDLNWQEETFKLQIDYLVETYGKRFEDIYRWYNEGGPQNKGRSLLKRDQTRRWKDELDSISNMLKTGKKSVSLELKGKIHIIEKRILYYISMKELIDCSQEIFSKLDTLSPDLNQKFILNEFIKALLMERAKKHGVYIHLVEDNQAGYSIKHALPREITEIINEWCDHKIRILTRARPTMEDIERELSIWQTPGSTLQQWGLLKHLSMKVGPVRQHPDVLFEQVHLIWKLYDEIELQQASLFQLHQQQLLTSRHGPATKGKDTTQQKPRPFRQMDPPPHELPQYLGFSKQAGPRFGSAPQLPAGFKHQQMDPAFQPFQQYPEMDSAYHQLPQNMAISKQVGPRFGSLSQLPGHKPQQMDPVFRLFQQYLHLTSQHTEAVPQQPKVCEYLYFKPQKPVLVPKQQQTSTANLKHLSHFGGPRSMPAAA